MRFFSTPYYRAMPYRDSSPVSNEEPMHEAPSRPSPSGARSRGTQKGEEMMLLEIQRLSFVKTELELYLDAYPDSQSALRYYRDVVKKLGTLTEEYEAQSAPLTASSARGDTWSWARGKWPWQIEDWR